MTNLELAKQTLEENKNLETIINPQPKKRIKLPLARDVNLVESIINKKLDTRTNQFKEKLLNQAKTKYKTEIDAIHQKAINLRKEAEKIGRLVEVETNENVTAKFMQGSYSDGYFGDLPEDMAKATEYDFFEASGENFPEIEKMKAEVEEFLLNARIGITPLSDVKPLLDKIDKILV